MDDASRQPPEIVRRLQRRREWYHGKGRAFRVGWVIAAIVVIAAGIPLTILPGPAFVLFLIGLVMLSFEFAWAQRLLDKALERGVDAKDAAANASPRQKALGGAAVVTVVAVAGVVIGVWIL